ncbi:MAG: CBS domain-containing protein [Bacteroidia bacterium]
MGDMNVKAVENKKDLHAFVKCLLKDVHALERMLQDDWFESDVIRIGAEQEMCLIDPKTRKPAPVNLKMLEIVNNEAFTTELAKFNMECNLTPRIFTGTAISDLHKELRSLLEAALEKVQANGAELAFTGILPTIRKSDVDISQLTPVPRYFALMDGLKRMRGDDYFELRLNGLDEMNIKQKTAMLEACNTSFQVHLQVRPSEFVSKYNVAQALAGPVMSVAVNSPLLFGRRLWHETRIALFQQSLDIRVFNEHLRERSPRVTFGNDWLRKSVVEIYHEDIARFKVLLSTEIDEDVFDKINNGITPKLRALNIHNSTVYRWNRPCYGISDNGKPHLRIENRILPAGPSLPDEIANAAFWIGLMNGLEDEIPEVTKVMRFDDAKNNFFAAARLGLDTKFRWFNGERISPIDLVLKRLLPVARHGLEKANIEKNDIDEYLGIIEARVKSGRTGAQWMLDSFSELKQQGVPRDEISSTITSAIIKHQYDAIPMHDWALASIDDIDYEPSTLTVEDFMNTDLITVDEHDIIELVANLMDWRRVRHILVEDQKGKLTGLISSRQVLRHFTKSSIEGKEHPEATQVKDIMVKKVQTIEPGDTITKAMEIMRNNRIGCLPVVTSGELVGVITESDYLSVTGNLLTRMERKRGSKKK